jgi:ribokinase
MSCVRRAVEIAEELKKTIILNPAPAQLLDETILRSVSILTPNESETELLAGIPVRTDEQVRTAARHLRNL